MRLLTKFVLGVTLSFAWLSHTCADEVLDKARAKLNTARLEAITLLEEAVLQAPQRTDYWIELLRALETDKASDFTLRCYAEAALKLNPDSLELHWEWIRVLPTAPALDRFAWLEKREPNRKLVEDVRTVLQHGLRPPRDWRDPAFYEEWASRLVYRADWEPAAEIIARGLALNPKSEALRTMEVMLLIGQKKYAAASEAHQKNNYRQTNPRLTHTDYPRVGDLFLLHQQPKLAVESFGPEPSPDLLKSREGLILGQALLQSGEVDYAERVFEQTEEVGANLLVIANLLELKKVDDARAVAEEWMKKWPGKRKEARICNNSALLCQGLYPISVQERLRKAVAWLYQTYPQRQELLESELPEPKETLPYDWPPNTSLASSATSWVEREQTALAALLKLPPKELDQKQLSEINRMLFNQIYPLQISGKYREAAEILRVQCEYAPYYADSSNWLLLASAASRQEFLRRDGALQHYRERPAELFQARQALALLQPPPGNRPGQQNLELQNVEQAVTAVARLDPHCLTLVYEKLNYHTKGLDQSPYVQMIAAHGDFLDSATLLKLLQVVNTYQPPNPIWEQGPPDKNHVLTVAAINSALQKFSGGKLAPPEQADPYSFWEKWWLENQERLFAKE